VTLSLRQEHALLWLLWIFAAIVFYRVAGATQGSYDTYRDLWYAAAISGGHLLPTIGPGINQTFHLGPLWFYLLGGLSVLIPLPESVVLACALLVAAKFPLAYLAGRALLDRWTGLFMVALIAAPGWWFFELAVITHTSATAAAVLLLVYCLARVLASTGEDSWPTVRLGLACTLAVHAHPTTVMLCVAAVVALWWLRPWSRQPVPIAMLLILPLVSVLPYLLGGGLGADLQSLSRYAGGLVGDGVAADRLVSLPLASLLGGGIHVFWLWLDTSLVSAICLSLLPLILAGTACISAVTHGVPQRHTHLAAASAITYLAQCAFLVGVREVTPVWMMFALAPIAALGMAALLSGLAYSRPALARRVLVCILATGVCLSGVVLHHLATRSGTLLMPTYPEGSPGLMSISEIPHGKEAFHPLDFSVLNSGSRLPVSCQPLQLHGSLAALADTTLGYSWVKRCGLDSQVLLGGATRTLANAYFAQWDPQTRQLCGDDEHPKALTSDVTPFTAHVSGAGIELGDPREFPPRRPRFEVSSRRLTLKPSTERFLYIGNLLPDYYPLSIESVNVNGTHAVELSRSPFGRVFECVGCSTTQPRIWTMALRTAPEVLDIVTFDCAAETPLH
jgi:hypothetical protein